MSNNTIDTVLGLIGIALFLAGVWWYCFKFIPVYLRVMDCEFETSECKHLTDKENI